MAKLSKMQAQAIISKLGRESTTLRNKLIEEERRNHTPSENARKLAELVSERDRAKAKLEAATDEAKRFADALGIKNYYAYTKAEDALSMLKDREIRDKYPEIDLNAALDDLIIESVEDDFSVDNFIESYLKQLRK